jgi:uncharacterized membrane protein
MIPKSRPKFDAKELLPLGIIALMFLSAIIIYPHMPARMPVHWNSAGEIDGYGSRFTGVLLMPIITLAIYLLLSIMPFISVYQKNIRSFYFLYFWFKVIFVVFMAWIYAASLFPNFGITISMNYLILPPMAGLIYFAGNLMENSKRNFFVGVRTQWTLTDDEVWRRTNRLAGRGFRAIAALMLASLLLKGYALVVPIIILVAFSIFCVVYSYLIYQKLHR